jgi:hypothetical protein
MGNTVVAHVLYACQQITLDLDNFFSSTGDAHKIQSLIHDSSLIAHHLIEYPTDDLTCIVELKSNDWFYVLQHRMSYAKWYKEYPTVENLNKFFNVAKDVDVDVDRLWIDFYNNIKDDSWPMCNTVNDIAFLPDYIRHEVENSYQPPTRYIPTNETHALEFLSKNYYDQIQKKVTKNFNTSVIYLLGDYFDNNYDVLKTLATDKFGWKWNQLLSNQFYTKMLEANAKHLNWLADMKSIYNATVNLSKVNVNLEFWERAMLIGKLCQHFNMNPEQLNWSDQNCFLSDNNVSLLNYFKKVNHGKTI